MLAYCSIYICVYDVTPSLTFNSALMPLKFSLMSASYSSFCARFGRARNGHNTNILYGMWLESVTTIPCTTRSKHFKPDKFVQDLMIFYSLTVWCMPCGRCMVNSYKCVVLYSPCIASSVSVALWITSHYSLINLLPVMTLIDRCCYFI